jgi:hypothetical protein
MITSKKKKEVLSHLEEIKRSVILKDGEDITIGELCNRCLLESEKLLESADSVAPILRTSLVMRWKESAMRSRYERFRTEFPEISTLEKLKNVIDNTDALKFCKNHLNINANSSANPKYVLLKELTNGFLEYQTAFGLHSEIEALRHWSLNVNLYKLKEDFIGKRPNVGIATIENIRLNLGYSTIKPDRHVIGVMTKCLGLDIPVEHYIEFANFIGINPRYLDCLLFEYGKLKRISA